MTSSACTRAVIALLALALAALADGERSPCASHHGHHHRDKRTTPAESVLTSVPPPVPPSDGYPVQQSVTPSPEQSVVTSEQSVQPPEPAGVDPSASSSVTLHSGGVLDSGDDSLPPSADSDDSRTSQLQFSSSGPDLSVTNAIQDVVTESVAASRTAASGEQQTAPADNALPEAALTSPTASLGTTLPAKQGGALSAKLLEERARRLEKIHRDILERKQRRGKVGKEVVKLDKPDKLDKLDSSPPLRGGKLDRLTDAELDKLSSKHVHRDSGKAHADTQTDADTEKLEKKQRRRGSGRRHADRQPDQELDDGQLGGRRQSDVVRSGGRRADDFDEPPPVQRKVNKKERNQGRNQGRDKEAARRRGRPTGSRRVRLDSDEDQLEDNSLSDESWEDTSLIGSSHSAEVSGEWGGLVCPVTEEVSLLSRQCKSDTDCSSVGEQCCKDRLGLRRCVLGVAPILPDIPHDPFFGVIARVCPSPVDTLVEPWSITNCTNDDECWPRVCCSDGPYAYCRTPQLEWEKLPGQRFVAPLRLLMSYLQCTPPPPPVFDLFPKPCRNTLDCFPNLCCQEKGRKVCRPPKRSLLALLATLGQGAGYAFKSNQRNHH